MFRKLRLIERALQSRHRFSDGSHAKVSFPAVVSLGRFSKTKIPSARATVASVSFSKASQYDFRRRCRFFIRRIGKNDLEFFGLRWLTSENQKLPGVERVPFNFRLGEIFLDCFCRLSIFFNKYCGGGAPAERFDSERTSASEKIEHSRADDRSPRLEKIAAFTRSIVGRTPRFGTARRIPPALPAITLMAMRLELALPWLQAALLRRQRGRRRGGHCIFSDLLFLLADPFSHRRSC